MAGGKVGRKPVPADKSREVFRLIDRGVSRKQVAYQLNIPVGTVATLVHRRNLQRRHDERVREELQPPGTG